MLNTEVRDDIMFWIYFAACLRRIRFLKEGVQMKGYQTKIKKSNYHNGRARYFHYNPGLRKVLKVLLQCVLRKGTPSLRTAPHGALPAAHERRLRADGATDSVERPPAGVFRAEHLQVQDGKEGH